MSYVTNICIDVRHLRVCFFCIVVFQLLEYSYIYNATFVFDQTAFVATVGSSSDNLSSANVSVTPSVAAGADVGVFVGVTFDETKELTFSDLASAAMPGEGFVGDAAGERLTTAGPVCDEIAEP